MSVIFMQHSNIPLRLLKHELMWAYNCNECGFRGRQNGHLRRHKDSMRLLSTNAINMGIKYKM